MLAVIPLLVATMLSGCGSGCGTLGVANTSTCDSATSSANATATASSFSISGTVSGGTPLGVTITLTGAGTGSTTTDANGNYSFTALPNGSYNLVPSLAGNAFAPVSTAVTISGANVTAASFTEPPIGGKLRHFRHGKRTGGAERVDQPDLGQHYYRHSGDGRERGLQLHRCCGTYTVAASLRAIRSPWQAMP